MKKLVPAIGVLLVAGILYLVVQNNHEPKALQTDQVFHFRIRSDPPTLDWSRATDHVSITIIDNIMEGLVQYDEKLQPVPALASNWDISKNGKTYTFHLRKNIFWTDGQPIKASDFEYSWKRLLNPETAAEYAYFLFDVEGAEDYNTGKTKTADHVGVRALDDSTLQVQLRVSASYFLHIPAFVVTFPMRKDVVEKYGDHWTQPENIITCGAFKLKEWRHKDKVVLEANPSFYEGAPKLKEVYALVINSDQTAVDLYETSKLDILSNMPPLTIEKYKDHSSFVRAPFLRGYYYGFNVTKPPFNDVRVRKAFAMAIDKSVFPEILRGGQIPTASWVPPGMAGYEKEVGLKYDVQKAQALLAEAGFPQGKNFPEATAYFDSRDDNKTIAEQLQQLWKKNLNVHVNIENQEWKVHLKHIQTDPPQLFRLGWGADFPDPDNFLRLFTSTSGNNNTKWKNATYDKFIFEAAAEGNLEKRLKLYHDAQKILLETDVAIIPLFVDSLNLLVKPYVKGFWSNAMDKLLLKKIWINKSAG